MRIPISLAVAVVAAGPAAASSQHAHHDSAFKAVQHRGALVMGVDQYTSTHRFEALADGGRIELQRDVDDSVGVRTIREHLQTIAHQFAAGDFSASATVHGREVPGTAAMRARRAVIRYEYRPLARGGEVRITTHDRAALRAIHEFLAFQRADHRTEKEGDRFLETASMGRGTSVRARRRALEEQLALTHISR
jgi:hypothetical protein